MRHKDFATTEKHYGAMRSAQSAGAEIIARLRPANENIAFVGGMSLGASKPATHGRFKTSRGVDVQ
jgi:hypothetical protein